ncbi:MAG: PKD repeat protein [Candidatus Endobugula sp.]|jgi:PKD repeat protein
MSRIAKKTNRFGIPPLSIMTMLLLFGYMSAEASTELNLAPNCSLATASPSEIWPPNNRFRNITINGVIDPEGQGLTIASECVLQSDPVKWWKWYRGRYDASGLSTDTPAVRAKKASWYFDWVSWRWIRPGDRKYAIVFSATDGEGAMCRGKVEVDILRRKPRAQNNYFSRYVKYKKTNVPRYLSVPGGVNCDAAPINNPPIIISQPIIDSQVNVPYEYIVKGHDPDQNTLQFSLVTGPSGMSIDSVSGLLQWTPTLEQEGVQNVTVQVQDTGALMAEQTYTITAVAPVDELSARIVANPSSGLSPLAVRFSPDVNNNNIVISNYAWDFDGDGTTDRSDTFGAPQNYTYTGNPGDQFEATLIVTPVEGEPLVATQTISINNEAPVVNVVVNVNNGHAPLSVNFTVTASDPQGIQTISIDSNGDGTVDEVQQGAGVTSSTWTFTATYQNEGSYVATVRVNDVIGDETVIVNNAITVDVNNPSDPIITFLATPQVGNTPLGVSFIATAELFDGSSVTQWRWDTDGDGVFETEGGNTASDTLSFTYTGVDYYYPVVEVTTDSNRTAKASLAIEARSSAVPSLSIPNSSDTINSDAGQEATFTVSLPFDTELSVWIEDANGERVDTVQAATLTTAGIHNLLWDGQNTSNEVVAEGDYYVVLGYTTYGSLKEVDLRTSTGGTLTYYRRTTANPRTFNRLKEPLRIDYGVDDPAQVSFFWQISFGARLMTLIEHERMGRGQYSLYWNADYPSGEKVPDNLTTLMPGILRYSLPNNVIFVKENPRIESFTLRSTVLTDPRREPIGLNVRLSKPSSVEMIVADMDRGVNVATRVFNSVAVGEHTLEWDGKNNEGQFLAPSDYRIGVRSVDSTGKRSLFWYRTQRIDY